MIPACILLSILVHPAELYSPEEHFSIIQSVREYFDSPTVVFLNSRENREDLTVNTILHNFLSKFSRNGTSSSNIFFDDISKTKYSYSLTVKPLFVALMHSENALEEFKRCTSYFDMSFSGWLVIFMSKEINGMTNSCHEQSENIFHVAFDTQMLVLCNDDYVLREWYSIDKKSLVIRDHAIWKPETGLRIVTPLKIHERRTDLNGTVLRAIAINPNYLWKGTRNAANDVCQCVLKELSKTLNFTVEIVEETTFHGIWDSKKLEWNGAIGKLLENKADLIASALSMSTMRMQVVDFTSPFLTSKHSLYIREPDAVHIHWHHYFKIFHTKIWLLLGSILFLVPLLITLMMRVIKYSQNTYTILCDNYTYIWGIFCLQGLPDFSYCSSVRLAYMAVILSSVVTNIAYSATLIGYLTVNIVNLPFHSMNGFVEDGTYGFITLVNNVDLDFFKYSPDPFSIKIRKQLRRDLPFTVEDAFSRICKEKVAFYTSVGTFINIYPFLQCDISKIDGGTIENISIGLSKDSPYKDAFNHHIQKLRNSGMLDRYIKKYKITKFRNSENRVITVDLTTVTPILTIAFGSFFTSLAALLIERWFYKHFHNNNDVNCPRKFRRTIWSNEAAGKRSRT